MILVGSASSSSSSLSLFLSSSLPRFLFSSSPCPSSSLSLLLHFSTSPTLSPIFSPPLSLSLSDSLLSYSQSPSRESGQALPPLLSCVSSVFSFLSSGIPSFTPLYRIPARRRHPLSSHSRRLPSILISARHLLHCTHRVAHHHFLPLPCGKKISPCNNTFLPSSRLAYHCASSLWSFLFIFVFSQPTAGWRLPPRPSLLPRSYG